MPNTSLVSELIKKENIEDDNLIIVEDNEDTKQSTVKILKKNFNGDVKDPSSLLFYSSAKINEIKESLMRDISAKANISDFLSLEKTIKDIIIEQSESDTKDIEIIAARDGCDTLDDRLNRDKQSLSSRSLNKYKRTVSGNRVYLGNFSGYADVLVDTSTSGNLVVSSVNYFNIENIRGANDAYMSYSDYGFSYKQIMIQDDKFLGIYIPISNIPFGNYYFSANLFNDEVVDKYGNTVKFKIPTNVQIGLTFTDRSVQYTDMEITDNNSNLFYFNFTTNKTLKEISFLFPEEDFVEDSVLRFENVMISSKELLDTFVPYSITKYPVSGKQYVNDVKVENCELYFEDFSCDIIVDYYDNTYTTEYIIDHLNQIENNVNDQIDQCGIATNYGDYNFFNMTNSINRNENSTLIEMSAEDKYVRNGHKCLKVTYLSQDDMPSISMNLSNVPSDIKYITLVAYINKTVSYYMEQDAFTVCLVSDKPNVYPPNNYFQKVVDRNSIIQGWNSIKLVMEEFETIGNPSKNDINYIIIKFSNSFNLRNKSIYLNSIIFNQSVKPTVLLGFNGVYDNTFDYTLPTIASRGLQCSIFMSDNKTLTNTEFDSMIMYRLSFLDIGQFGCNPDKELLLEDDNYREQYLALRNTRNYLQTNLVNNPVSYSAPYGNIRPITADMLNDLGYKIAKTGEDSFCSFFTKKDICIPSIELNNESDVEYIKSKIDRAINTEQVVAISTYDVTEYGDELNAKKSSFEEILTYISEKCETGQLECLSYKSFYEKCVK